MCPLGINKIAWSLLGSRYDRGDRYGMWPDRAPQILDLIMKSKSCRSARALQRTSDIAGCAPIISACLREDLQMMQGLRRLWWDEQGQDIAEYAVMLAVILVIVVGTIRLIGSNSNTVFSQVASSIQ